MAEIVKRNPDQEKKSKRGVVLEADKMEDSRAGDVLKVEKEAYSRVGCVGGQPRL